MNGRRPTPILATNFVSEERDFALGKPRQTNVDERFAWNTCIIRNAANPIDSPELGVIRKGVDGVNGFSHWPIIHGTIPNRSFQHPRLVVANNVETLSRTKFGKNHGQSHLIWHLTQHCVRAKCSCQEAALSFFELRPSAQYSGVGSEPTLCIRYAYDTGQIEPLSRAKDGRWSGQDFVDALREVLPDLDPVLAKRQALLRRLYRRALSQKTIRLQAPKTGRNERCPCGSGKKYKKCCGA